MVMSESTAGKGDSRRSEKDAGSYSENFEGIDWSNPQARLTATEVLELRRCKFRQHGMSLGVLALTDYQYKQVEAKCRSAIEEKIKKDWSDV